MLKVRFADPSICNKQITDTVVDVLNSGGFINGKWCRLFSEMWASYCGANHCVPVASGSAALITALNALRAKFGPNYVIIPDLSFAATAFAVLEANCTPIVCGVDQHGLMDQNHCIELLNEYSGVIAVIPVHLYGQVLKINQQLLDKVPVIEDACQAHGTFIQGVAACFSFYPSKNLGAAGDAGALVTNLAGLANRAKAYVNYGDYPGEKYIHSVMGNNLRMDELQAAVLTKKLELDYLKAGNDARKAIAQMYIDGGIVSYTNPVNNVYHLYPILVENPITFIRLLREHGIEAGNHYPYRLANLVRGSGLAPSQPTNCSTLISQCVLTLPIGPHMLESDVAYVIDVFKKLAVLEDNIWRLNNAN